MIGKSRKLANLQSLRIYIYENERPCKCQRTRYLISQILFLKNLVFGRNFSHKHIKVLIIDIVTHNTGFQEDEQNIEEE